MGILINTQELPSEAFADMALWFDTPLGKVLLESEHDLLENLLPRRFGYHLLQLGCANLDMFNASPIGHKFRVSTQGFSSSPEVLGRAEALPIASNSIDLVLLHHALDFSAHQHQLLREVSRVLIEGGDVIIIGFNPLSTWGVRKALQWPKKIPWFGERLSSRRLIDWLQLLEFKIEKINYGAYTLPFNSPSIIKYSSLGNKLATKLNWPTGGVYAISAKKQISPLTPIQAPWRKLRKSSVLKPVIKPALPVPKSSASNSHIKLNKS